MKIKKIKWKNKAASGITYRIYYYRRRVRRIIIILYYICTHTLIFFQNLLFRYDYALKYIRRID